MRTRLFYLSAFLLALNDFWLKAEFHNVFTGKLSDFAGTALWVLFWEAWLPQRFRRHLYCLSAILFVWFKSPLSEGILQVLHLQRVVDYSDLYALLVLLPLYFLNKKINFVTWHPTVFTSLIALFLFGATSPPRADLEPLASCEPNIYYGIKQPRDSVFAHIRKRYPTQNSIEGDYASVGFRPSGCEKGISARFLIKQNTLDSTTISVQNYTTLCPESLPIDSICGQIKHKIIPSFY
jgi:hypothetical protein